MRHSQSGQADWKWTFTMLLVVFGFASIAWVIHFEASKVFSQVETADKRMARVETAVHILAGAQDEKTRAMVDEALTISQNAAASSAELLNSIKDYMDRGDKLKAAEAADSARSLLLAAKEGKNPVPPGYFVNAIAVLDNVPSASDFSIAGRLLSARVALAEYHSVLQPTVEFPAKQVSFKNGEEAAVAPATLNGAAVYRVSRPLILAPKTAWQSSGAVVDGSEIASGTDLLRPVSTSLAKNSDSIQGVIFAGVTQTLDGIEWKDVVFVNARIRYQGGDVKLENVRFVNCTFEVPQNDRGAQLADYAALESNSLNIG